MNANLSVRGWALPREEFTSGEYRLHSVINWKRLHNSSRGSAQRDILEHELFTKGLHIYTAHDERWEVYRRVMA